MTLPREVGVETRPCGNCGASLAVQENGDGSTSTVACEKCYPKTEKASVESEVMPREHGVVPDDDQED
jgi:hypothetical protein